MSTRATYTDETGNNPISFDVPTPATLLTQHFGVSEPIFIRISGSPDAYNLTQAEPAKTYVVVGAYRGLRKDKTRRSNIGEGLNLDDPVISWRDESIKKIWTKLQQQGVLLVRTPPYSGKSSFARLLEAHLSSTPDVSCHAITLLGLPGQKDDTDTAFDNYFQDRVGITVEKAMETEDLVIIIDEAQRAYGKRAPNFWPMVKDRMQSDRGPLLLFLAGYGEQQTINGTPIEFEPEFCVDMEEFRLTDKEALEMLRNWNASFEGKEVPIAEELFSDIVAWTGRHAGLFRKTIRVLRNNFIAKVHSLNSQQLVEEMRFYLLSGDYTTTIEQTRAIPKLTLSADQKSFLRDVIHAEDGLLRFPTDSSTEKIATDCVKLGFLVRHENKVEFASPVLRNIFIKKLISSPQPSWGTKDFETFTKLTLSNMRKDQLAKSISIGADEHLVEAQWQDEFYYAGTSQLANAHCMSPEVSAVAGIKINGRIDFYVDGGLRWGYELLREGDRFVKHVNRFLSKGTYYKLPLNDYAVIDFRATYPDDLEIPENTWIVVYAKDFSSFDVYRTGKPKLCLRLVGKTV